MAHAENFKTVAIVSAQLHATFVPGAGMLCSSLCHEGAELLAQRRGVAAYAEHGSTMAIPLLYPWANRLAAPRYPGPHGDVVLARENALLKFDANGLPIHGVLAGALSWELLESESDRLHARLRWERPELLAIFPFAHVLEQRASIAGATLSIETSVFAPHDAPAPVPVSFGYHPYLTIPGSDRRDWQVELPAGRRVLLDAQMIPTGVGEDFAQRRFALADSSWDDAFAELEQPACFAVSDRATRIELELREGYSHAQVYSPKGAPFICFEPMSAPTNALISRDALPVVEPGGEFLASFSISVAR
jgi:galactose mutarotase-like enzyme